MFSVENNDRKEQKKVKMVSKQMCVSSQQMKEGAVASHLPSASWLSRQAVQGSVSTETTLQEAPIKYC
jgi:hypothetical protein